MRISAAVLMSALLLLTACGGATSEPTAAPTTVPTVEVAATEMPTLEASPAITETTDVTDTTDMSDTTDMTDSEAMTDTEEMSNTDDLSGTVDMTDTMGVSGSMVITDTADMTDTTGMSETGETGAITALAALQDAEGNAVGEATFTQAADGVTIQVTVQGLAIAAAGEHGIHLHTTGACTPDFEAAGPHFNPAGAQHGTDNPGGPHAGDLPNLEIDADGNGTYEATTDLATLGEGENSLLDADGSAIVIHADPDDMITDPSGNSGDRIACGVIEQQ
jgi:Cu-Zn family superoxide dismutase